MNRIAPGEFTKSFRKIVSDPINCHLAMLMRAGFSHYQVTNANCLQIHFEKQMFFVLFFFRLFSLPLIIDNRICEPIGCVCGNIQVQVNCYILNMIVYKGPSQVTCWKQKTPIHCMLNTLSKSIHFQRYTHSHSSMRMCITVIILIRKQAWILSAGWIISAGWTLSAIWIIELIWILTTGWIITAQCTFLNI